MRFLRIVPIILFFMGSCDKADEFTQFTMTYNSEITIQSSVGIDVPVQIKTPEIESNAESKFEVNDTRKDLVEEILLQESTLTITQPEDGDFSFLNDISLYINADGLDKQLIASKENIPDDIGAELQLDVNSIDIKEYIKKEEFTLSVTTVTDEIISEDHVIGIESVFWVDAEILGQ